MMSRAVVRLALRLHQTSLEKLPSPFPGLLEGPTTSALSRGKDFHGCERFGRPRPETIECESGFLAGLNVRQNVVVLLLGRFTLPVEVWRIVGRQLDAGSAWEYRVLLCAAAAQHQVFHIVDVEEFRSVDVPIEYDHLHVSRIR